MPRLRATRYLPKRSAGNLSRAVPFADEIGRPLNISVDLNFGRTACEEEVMTDAFRRLLKSFFVKWHNRHPANLGKAATYVWVGEGRAGFPGIHWLLNLDPSLVPEFERELPRWLQKTAGVLLDPAAIKVQRAWRPGGKADYMLKGLHPNHARRYSRVKPSFQGTVYGKRCGFSENIGPAAIAKHHIKIAVSAGA